MRKTIIDKYPSAQPTERKDHFRQDCEDKVRNRWAVLAGLALAGLVGVIYLVGGEVIASLLLGMICLQMAIWSIWLLPRKTIVLREKDGQRYGLHSRQDTRIYARTNFVRIIILLVPAIFILSMDGNNTTFTITFVIGMIVCALAERYRLVRSSLD